MQKPLAAGGGARAWQHQHQHYRTPGARRQRHIVTLVLAVTRSTSGTIAIATTVAGATPAGIITTYATARAASGHLHDERPNANPHQRPQQTAGTRAWSWPMSCVDDPLARLKPPSEQT